MLFNNVKLETDIFVKANGKSLKLGMNKKLSVVSTNSINLDSKKYVSIETDIRLLKRLLMGPKYAHWNNAEIGSHLKFYRKPNVLERNIHSALIYFHC
tara:strand:+ start:123 stop:416 length:294 start_codon:yes stop_codon:yes gene_type:complete